MEVLEHPQWFGIAAKPGLGTITHCLSFLLLQ